MLAEWSEEHPLHLYLNSPWMTKMSVGGVTNGVREEDLLRE